MKYKLLLEIASSVGMASLPFAAQASLPDRNGKYEPTTTQSIATIGATMPIIDSHSAASWQTSLEKWTTKLERLNALKDGWDGYAAPAPGSLATLTARDFLLEASHAAIAPSRLAPSVVGGVGVTIRNGESKAYVEFRNDGVVFALFSDGVTDPIIRPVRPEPKSLAGLVIEIKSYLNV